MDYTPSKTIAEFMRSDARIRALVGPLGSGKSMGALMELFRRSVEQTPDSKGIRPTRWALIRNTAQQLRETLLKDATQYFGEFFTHKVSTGVLEFRFRMADGTSVESDWLTMPLDRPEDQRKLLSLNLTGALIDECREVPYDVIAALNGRIGRYPPLLRAPRTWRGMILVSNPWSVASEYHENFVLNPPDDWGLYKQPGGLDPDAENLQFLDKDYYSKLMQGQNDEWIKVHVHGQWGDDLSGKAVYIHSWDLEVHARDSLQAIPSLPLLIGMDFGRQPAAILTQEDMFGRLLVLEEFIRADRGLDLFLDELIPHLRTNYPGFRVFVVGDPSGVARSDLREESAFSVLQAAGLQAMPAPTNDPIARIQAVERRLIQRTARGPGLLVDRRKAPVILEGFERGYRYKRMRNGEASAAPDKNRFSHPHDGLQYAALGHGHNYLARRLQAVTRRNVIRTKPMSPLAWS
jgi:hypothetical protein